MTPRRKEYKVRHASALYTDLLSTGMYDAPAALWEAVKNGWDAIERLRQIRGTHMKGRVELKLVRNHPLSPRQPALIILDNGTGLDERSLERFLTVGNPDGVSDSMTDQKRVGRIAVFALIKSKFRTAGFRVISSTSSTGDVMMLDVNPEDMAQGVISATEMSRDDTRLHGICPKGSFTMIVVPYVVTALNSPEKLRKALEWYIPRFDGPNGFDVIIDGKPMQAPPLAKDLVIHWSKETGEVRVLKDREARKLQGPLDLGLQDGDIYGFFAKDESKSPAGLRICDSTTLTMMARAKNMSDRVPFPFGRPELMGDLFIHGLVRSQNTDRSGLSPEFLNSETWDEVVRVLLQHFSKPLIRLIGDEGIYRTDPLGRTMREVLGGFERIWGKPARSRNIPSGIDPGEDDDQNGNGSEPPEKDSEPKSSGERKRRPSRKRKMRPRLFNYKGTTYVLSASRQDPEVPAELVAPNVVMVNTRDPFLSKHFKSATAASRFYLYHIVIRVIERSLHELDPEAADRATQASLNQLYE